MWRLSALISRCSTLFISDSKVEDKSNFEENDDDTWRNFGRSIFQIRAAATTNLAVAAARAKLLADQEERQMEFLVAYIIDLQVFEFLWLTFKILFH